MREILDNARYAPTVGRYKVYLIDEVHMLSKPAFNSMLKTLEEPPEHVKFVLATTDPQKIPVTVLSRCLQFNLKPLPPAMIAERLATILDAEGHRRPMRRRRALIAKAARGSMRDALSLLDQAIAFGGGEVREAAGARDAGRRRPRLRLPDRRCGEGGQRRRSCSRRPMRWPRAAWRSRRRSRSSLRSTIGSRSLRRCPESIGFDGRRRADGGLGRVDAAGERPARLSDLRTGPHRPAARAGRGDRLLDDAPAAARLRAGRRASGGATRTRPSPRWRRTAPRGPVAAPPAASLTPRASGGETAVDAVSGRDARRILPSGRRSSASLKLPPIAAQLAAQTELKSIEGNVVTLALPAAHKHLADKAYSDKLKTALDQATGRKWLLAFEVGGAAESSLAAQEKRARAEQQAKNEAGVQERAVRARRPRAVRREDQARFDQAGFVTAKASIDQEHAP